MPVAAMLVVADDDVRPNLDDHSGDVGGDVTEFGSGERRRVEFVRRLSLPVRVPAHPGIDVTPGGAPGPAGPGVAEETVIADPQRFECATQLHLAQRGQRLG